MNKARKHSGRAIKAIGIGAALAVVAACGSTPPQTQPASSELIQLPSNDTSASSTRTAKPQPGAPLPSSAQPSATPSASSSAASAPESTNPAPTANTNTNTKPTNTGGGGGGGGYSGGSWGWTPPSGWQPGIYDGPVLSGPPSPLSGLPSGKDTRILAVKIDNTPSAQPHVGLSHADLVYIQEVEGGLTRLLALYSSRKPNQIGPVRSARISDLEILAPYGKVAFAFSGAQRKLKHKVYNGNLYDLSEWRGPVGWFIDKSRPVWWNAHMLSPKHIMTRAPKAQTAQDMRWTFDTATPPGGKNANKAALRWPASTAEFHYDPSEGNYLVWFNGQRARGTEVSNQRAETVIIQRVRQSDSGYGDRYGGKTPYIHTVGTGKAWMLRDGKVWPLTWEKGRKKLTTVYRFENGQRAQFKPGQLWIALLPSTSSPTIS